MTLDYEVLRSRFQSNVDDICRACIHHYHLVFSEADARVSSPLLRWVEYRQRYIDPVARTVGYSNRFPKSLPSDVQQSIEMLEKKLSAGEDINSYQSRGLRRNDLSSKNTSDRTDRLWAEWGIHHLHLTIQKPRPGDYFHPRSDWHLLVMFAGKNALYLDAVPHLQGNQYSDVDLLRIAVESWPDYMAKYELRGIATARVITSEQRERLRKGGVNTPVEIDGKIYMGPNWGLTSAVTPGIATLAMDRVRQAVDDLAQWLCSSDSTPRKLLLEMGVNEPDFSLGIQRDGIHVYESKSRYSFHLLNNSEIIAQLEYLFPSWVRNDVVPADPM